MNNSVIDDLWTKKIGLKARIDRRGEHREEERTEDQGHADECLSRNK